MSLLWYPEHIERTLSRGMRQAQEARERQEAGTPAPLTTSPSPQPERVLLEWVEPVELGEVTGWVNRCIRHAPNRPE